MDFLIPNGQNTIENTWPDELSIEQIAVRSAPNDIKKQAGIRHGLIDLCKSRTLKFYGSITGWKYINGKNPYPRATERDYLTTQEIVRGVIPSASGRHCLIHKDNFKSYLQSIGQWPVQDSPLVNWWVGGEPEVAVKQKIIKNDGEKEPRKRKDNLSRAINSAITSLGYKPSFDELWQYFQCDKDESGFIVDFTEDKITWTDTKGKLHDTSKTTLANRLSRVRS